MQSSHSPPSSLPLDDNGIKTSNLPTTTTTIATHWIHRHLPYHPRIASPQSSKQGSIPLRCQVRICFWGGRINHANYCMRGQPHHAQSQGWGRQLHQCGCWCNAPSPPSRWGCTASAPTLLDSPPSPPLLSQCQPSFLLSLLLTFTLICKTKSHSSDAQLIALDPTTNVSLLPSHHRTSSHRDIIIVPSATTMTAQQPCWVQHQVYCVMALTLTATSTITVRMVLEVVGRAQTAVHRCATLEKNKGRGFFSTLSFQNMCRGFFSTRKK